MCGIWAIFGTFDHTQRDDANQIQHRGPDNTHHVGFSGPPSSSSVLCVSMVFHRLSIMDTSSAGDQPFSGSKWTLMCNGEIYNYKDLRDKYLQGVYLQGSSDCEVIWQLLERGIMTFETMVSKLYGVYSIIAVEHLPDYKFKVYATRDRVGIRPLYWATDNLKVACLSSEPCALHRFGKNVQPFPPGSIWSFEVINGTTIHNLTEILSGPSVLFTKPLDIVTDNIKVALFMVRNAVERAVKYRLMSDRPIACLLSGGVDSSIVAALVAKFTNHPIHTFSIGMEGGPDLKYAKIVSQHIGSIHHEVILSEQDFLDAVPHVIKAIQSYDVTTVRASTPMYLLAKYIKENTDFKVIFSGEGPDEVCGSYMYFHAAPSVEAFDDECRRLVKDLHYFDVLRADRSTAVWGLELRVPFLSIDFIKTYWSIDPSMRMPQYGMEKWLLRKAHEDLLPSEITWRPKNAFSDAITPRTRSWYQILQEDIETKVTDDQLSHASEIYMHHTPQTKEAFWFRQLYESYYSGMSHLIPYQWLPRWVGDVKDPSARILEQFKE